MAERTTFVLALAAAVAAPLAGCYGPSTPYGAPCGGDIDCPSRQTCDLETSTCGPPSELAIWRDDTADDFGAAGAATDGAAIEPAGFVGPTAYFAAGLRLSGIDHLAIPDALTPWNEIGALPRTGTTFVRGAQLDFADTTPLGVGLRKGNDITVIVEGEIYLDRPGTWGFELTANDIGFLELAPPGSASFLRVVTDENNKTSGTFTVAAAGWHPLRGAFADAAGNMTYLLRYDPPSPGGFKQIPPTDLRAPAGDVAGIFVDGFEDPFLIGPQAGVVDAGTLAALSLTSDPFGLGIGNSSYSLRFAAQVLIDVGGSYELRIDSSQGHRAWIDGASIADKFDDTNNNGPQTTRTAPLALDPGWHDLVLDLNRSNATTTQLDVTVTAGPAWVGQTIPLDHLRPVVGRTARWAGGRVGGTTAITDGATTVQNVSFGVQPDLVTTRIEAAFSMNHPLLSTMEVKIDPPGGAPVTKVAAGSLTDGGTYYQHTTMPPATAGGSWDFLFTDTVAEAAVGDVTLAGVILLGSAGPAPFPKSYRYTSAPRELGGVASFSNVQWSLRQADPNAMVNVSLRTCDTAEACDGEPWIPVSDGTRPDLTPRRFAQYQIELTGGGDIPTALDWIEIGYRAYK